jgi:hypothetical protein
MKLLLTGLWVCVVTFGAAFGAATWQAGLEHDVEEPHLKGLEYRRLPTISVPMIADGAIDGYVVARFVYTADAGRLAALSVDPDPFVIDAAFSEIYENGRVEFDRISKYELGRIAEAVVTRVNERLAQPLVEDLLVEGINYVDRSGGQDA